MGRVRTSASIEGQLVLRGRSWCTRRGVGFGVLLEHALPLVVSDELVWAEPGGRVVAGFRVEDRVWAAALAVAGRVPAAPGVVCDSALRLFLPEPSVPFDLHAPQR